MAELKDSGERREFESGAVRDVQDDKGRCDLLPLYEVAAFFGPYLSIGPVIHHTDEVLESINQYVRNGDIGSLYTAMRFFCRRENIHHCTAILELSKHYEDGARKYQPRNWEKGIPLHCYIDSGVRHYLKYMRGDRDEPHDRAFLWNMFGAIWTHSNKPEMIDLPFGEKSKDPKPDYHERIEERAKKFRETSFA